MTGLFDEVNENDCLFAMREMHLDALKELQSEINGNGFLQLTSVDLAVRAEELRAQCNRMEKAHAAYRRCTAQSDNETYIEARRNYVRALSKIENHIRELDHKSDCSMFILCATRPIALDARDATGRCCNHGWPDRPMTLDQMKQIIHYESTGHTQQSNLALKSPNNKELQTSHGGTSKEGSNERRVKPYDRNKLSREFAKPDLGFRIWAANDMHHD